MSNLKLCANLISVIYFALIFFELIFCINSFFTDMFQVVVANAGDAKAVLARSASTDGEGAVVDNKSSLKAIVLTREHKAIFPQERSRIQKVN
jgi:hypothetical protein